MFEKFFKRLIKKEDAQPKIFFGRYSDNNKSIEKGKKWIESENLFREKKFRACVDVFFEYLKDDTTKNVFVEKKQKQSFFTIYQGSKVIRGKYDEVGFSAEVYLVRMLQPSIPAMRKLLEQNFFLYYTRFAVEKDKIVMRFDTDMDTANPNKLYYGLKELAIKSDQQDDLLLNAFAQLEPIDNEHIDKIPTSEIKIKLDFFRIFILETIAEIEQLIPEKHEVVISNLLLSLGYRLDYLITPQGKLLQSLEDIISIFYTKEDKSIAERNHLMLEAYRNMLKTADADIIPYLFRTKSTFSIVAPQPFQAVIEHITLAIEYCKSYSDVKYQLLVSQILEFGISYCQYSFSLPSPLSKLFHLLMEVNYPDYFMALGIRKPLFDKTTNQFNKKEIEDTIESIIKSWREKYPKLLFKTPNLLYDTLSSFNLSFVKEITILNFEGRK